MIMIYISHYDDEDSDDDNAIGNFPRLNKPILSCESV